VSNRVHARFDVRLFQNVSSPREIHGAATVFSRRFVPFDDREAFARHDYVRRTVAGT
jgi:hypothetical protein